MGLQLPPELGFLNTDIRLMNDASASGFAEFTFGPVCVSVRDG
jgi:hypothetical protein